MMEANPGFELRLGQEFLSSYMSIPSLGPIQLSVKWELAVPTRGVEAGKNYRSPTMLHVFLSFSVASLFVDCTN
jgi:hypothetical protein